MKGFFYYLPGLLIFLVGFSYRFYGLWHNHPFWVDEFSSANQAKLILQNGLSFFTNDLLNVEKNNIVNHLLMAISFGVFGQHEWSARLPAAVLGSFVPVVIFYLTKYLFNAKTALVATIFTLFSYLMITWSRQARGYTGLQLFVLTTLYLYVLILRGKKRLPIIIMFIISLSLGMLSHTSFILLIVAISSHFLIFNFRAIKNYLQKNKSIFIFLTILLLLTTLKLYPAFSMLLLNPTNNLWFYHSYLWREYGLITFLSLTGFLISFLSNARELTVFVIYFIIQLFFFSFVFPPYTTRYILATFPILLLFAAVTLVYLSESILKKFSFLLAIALVLFIVANGHKFSPKPKQYYSVNHDFREIALLDYHQVYSLIKNQIKNKKGKEIAVIDTWHDRAYWYLGSSYQHLYLFRWGRVSTGKTLGMERRTDFKVNTKGEKIITKLNNLQLITSLADFQNIYQKYPQGFIFIDDSMLPRDVIDFVEENLKKELFIDHYPLDDNPYSIWPATLYSWGIK